MLKTTVSFVLALALLVHLPAFGDELHGAIAVAPAPIYLLKEGHLPRDHWYSLKPGTHYWIYRLDNGAEKIAYEKIANVPDTRPISERNLAWRVGTNVLQWGVPLMVAAGVTLIGVRR